MESVAAMPPRHTMWKLFQAKLVSETWSRGKDSTTACSYTDLFLGSHRLVSETVSARYRHERVLPQAPCQVKINMAGRSCTQAPIFV